MQYALLVLSVSASLVAVAASPCHRHQGSDRQPVVVVLVTNGQPQNTGQAGPNDINRNPVNNNGGPAGNTAPNDAGNNGAGNNGAAPTNGGRRKRDLTHLTIADPNFNIFVITEEDVVKAIKELNHESESDKEQIDCTKKCEEECVKSCDEEKDEIKKTDCVEKCKKDCHKNCKHVKHRHDHNRDESSEEKEEEYHGQPTVPQNLFL